MRAGNKERERVSEQREKNKNKKPIMAGELQCMSTSSSVVSTSKLVIQTI